MPACRSSACCSAQLSQIETMTVIVALNCCGDHGTGDRRSDVIPENQLGESDHQFFAQIITHATGTYPTTIFWGYHVVAKTAGVARLA